jgi:hypothetical protein
MRLELLEGRACRCLVPIGCLNLSFCPVAIIFAFAEEAGLELSGHRYLGSIVGANICKYDG